MRECKTLCQAGTFRITEVRHMKHINEYKEILSVLNAHYPVTFIHAELMRDAGSTTYAVYSGSKKYFLKVTKPAFYETIKSSVDINVFLQENNFSVPCIVFTIVGLPYIEEIEEDGVRFYILYDYLEGAEIDTEQDAEEIGALLGQFHHLMYRYKGELSKRDKQFYIGRYLNILEKKEYPKTAAFTVYGNELWNKVKNLPFGYCHGDMYSGNIQKTNAGTMYILDFDTSCEGFPMYDIALICNRTDYFKFNETDYFDSKNMFERFLPEYLKYNNLTEKEKDSFYNFIALYHFALQATILEIHGLDCVDNAFLDCQLDWLMKWKEQCENQQNT